MGTTKLKTYKKCILKLMRSEKGLSPILVILLIAVLIGGYLIYSGKINLNKSTTANIQTIQPAPTNNVTSEKTYINKQLGVMFQYPPSYTLEKDTPSEVSFTILFQPGNQKVTSLIVTTSLTDPKAVTINHQSNAINGMFGGRPVIFFHDEGGDAGTEFIQTTELPKVEVRIITNGGGETKNQDLIKSSFKFLDQNLGTDGLKTYTNTKYGYSLQYQSNPKLKQYSCSANEALKEGEDIFALEDINSKFPKCGFGGYRYPVSIEVKDNPVDCKSDHGYTATKTPLTVSGIEVSKCNMKYTGDLSNLGPGLTDYTFVVIPKNGKYFYLEIPTPDYLEIFNQILSTFKFQ